MTDSSLRRRHLAVGLTVLTGACANATGGSSRVLPSPSGNPASWRDAGHGTIASPDAFSLLNPPSPSSLPGCSLPADAGNELNSIFDPYVVTHADVGHRVIYSWTSQAQIEELKLDPTLLTRSMSTAGERGRAANIITSRVATDTVAALVDRPEHQNKRWGWTNPWATLLGWTGETYGDQLLEIRLRPEAWIGRLMINHSTPPDAGAWQFFDVDNNPVDLALVQANPERIAGVYFVDETVYSECQGTFSDIGGGFREYFVCNEAMLESWSAYTSEILGELTGAVTVLQQFRGFLAEQGCDAATERIDCWREALVEQWGRSPKGLREAYDASIPFPNELYAPNVANMDRLVAGLQSVLFQPAPLVHTYP